MHPFFVCWYDVRVSAREHSQKQSTQMKKLCSDLQTKNAQLEREVDRYQSAFKELGEFIVKSAEFQAMSAEAKEQINGIVQKVR